MFRQASTKSKLYSKRDYKTVDLAKQKVHGKKLLTVIIGMSQKLIEDLKP